LQGFVTAGLLIREVADAFTENAGEVAFGFDGMGRDGAGAAGGEGGVGRGVGSELIEVGEAAFDHERGGVAGAGEIAEFAGDLEDHGVGVVAEVDNMCISCHEPGRLKPTLARD
jgi:hypothetical protein